MLKETSCRHCGVTIAVKPRRPHICRHCFNRNEREKRAQARADINIRRDPNLVDRALFWGKVMRGTEEECWLYQGHRTDRGYGRYVVAIAGRRFQFSAHRLAFFFHNGMEAGDLVVRHKCDNPPCCNPRHLELGTVIDNNRDRDERGRTCTSIGSARPSSVLTEDQVANIKARHLAGTLGSLRAAAREFGVTRTPLTRIIRGEAWTHVRPAVEAGAGREVRP